MRWSSPSLPALRPRTKSGAPLGTGLIVRRPAGRGKLTSPEFWRQIRLAVLPAIPRSSAAHLDAGDRPLAPAQDQVPVVEQAFRADPLLGVGDPLVVDVGAALGDCAPGVVQRRGEAGLLEERGGGGQFPRYRRKPGLGQRGP